MAQMTPEQEARVAEIRARYPGQRIFPGEVVMAEEPEQHPGLEHCSGCMWEQEDGYAPWDPEICCCRYIGA